MARGKMHVQYKSQTKKGAAAWIFCQTSALHGYYSTEGGDGKGERGIEREVVSLFWTHDVCYLLVFTG